MSGIPKRSRTAMATIFPLIMQPQPAPRFAVSRPTMGARYHSAIMIRELHPQEFAGSPVPGKPGNTIISPPELPGFIIWPVSRDWTDLQGDIPLMATMVLQQAAISCGWQRPPTTEPSTTNMTTYILTPNQTLAAGPMSSAANH